MRDTPERMISAARSKSAADSLLEGDGFEPSVPHQGQRFFESACPIRNFPFRRQNRFLPDRDAGPSPPYRLRTCNRSGLDPVRRPGNVGTDTASSQATGVGR
jgi:hypothetical protein